MIEKIFKPAVLIALGLLLLIQSCNKSKALLKIDKEQTELVKNLPNKEEVNLMIQIQTTEMARKIVYDNNSFPHLNAGKILLKEKTPDSEIVN